jgi:hypothetical protein
MSGQDVSPDSLSKSQRDVIKNYMPTSDKLWERVLVWGVDRERKTGGGMDSKVFVACAGAAFKDHLRAVNTKRLGEKSEQMIIGFALNRGSGNAYFIKVAMGSDKLVTPGTRLYPE